MPIPPGFWGYFFDFVRDCVYNRHMMKKTQTASPVTSECMDRVRELYDAFTGSQIAQCIGVLRAEIEAMKEQAEIEQQIQDLTARLQQKQ